MKEYYTRKHKIIELSAWLLILLSFAIAIYGIVTLPPTIATHFNAAGKADGYGSPAALLVMPIIITIPLGIISLVTHFLPPSEWNTSFKVKSENATIVYRDMVTVMTVMELEIAAFTLFIQIKSFQQDGKGMMPFAGLFLLIVTASIIILLRKAYRHNNSKPESHPHYL